MINNIKLTPNSTIKEALQIIEKGAIKFAIVLDENQKLLGTVTDGDIRRAILKGFELKDTITQIYFKSPTVATISNSNKEIIKICTRKKIYQIPIVNEEGKVVAIKELDELLKPTKHDNKIILMVGGLGTRLRPLTDNIPKPMLHVGKKPILQTIIERFVDSGFSNITLCVGYKAEAIKDYFQDGSEFGANIEYIFENKRMGTAGALSLLSEESIPKKPFFVMNGDLLTNVDFEKILEYHLDNQAKATMCVRTYDYQIPFGVVKIDETNIVDIEEKPIHKSFVNAGIYVLNPELLQILPTNEFYDMPTLFKKMIEKKLKLISFPLHEYWLDIGRVEEYERANLEYGEL